MKNIKSFSRPLNFNTGRVDLNHGAGGRASMQLIQELFAAAFANEWLEQGDDGAVLPALEAGQKLVMSTDAHVVSPLFFPGGDIGSLSVHGTINDIAVMGARPLYLSASFILEEGFPLDDLRRIVQSMGAASRDAGVPIVTGDTKVVERGKGDGVFISTAGVGALRPGRNPSGRNARPGDRVLVSGSIGDHGMAVLAEREALELGQAIRSDSAALHRLTESLFTVVPAGDIRVLRDPTRGGLATTLNEIAVQSGVGISIDERSIPFAAPVQAACELLGLDPLYLANEGKLVVVCSPESAEKILDTMQGHSLARNAACIGVITEDPHHFVQLKTPMGGTRMLDWLHGEPLPRIC